MIESATTTNLCAHQGEKEGSAVRSAKSIQQPERQAGASKRTPPAPDRRRAAKSARLEDDDATEALEHLIALRRQVEQDGKASRPRALLAALHCARLIRGIMGWAAEDMGILLPPAEFAELPLEDRRRLAAVNIGFGLPVFQLQASMELSDGLLALNGGQDDPFLRKTGAGRRRAAPWAAALAEFDLLKWIRWQHGLGRKVADAETDVAQAVGCTREAVQKWRSELPKVLGAAHVRDQLALAERIGALEARDGGRIDHRPWDTDAGHVLWIGSENLDRDLPGIAERRRAAAAKRRVAKSEDK